MPGTDRICGRVFGTALAELLLSEGFLLPREHLPDLETGDFRPGLRVKKLKGHAGIYEMTWAPDGRATWQYGPEQVPGKTHVIWRRLGTHAIFDPGPP